MLKSRSKAKDEKPGSTGQARYSTNSFCFPRALCAGACRCGGTDETPKAGCGPSMAPFGQKEGGGDHE
jgi:hypothetical protein